MAYSLALIILSGLLAGYVMRSIRMPELVGMLAAGVALGPYGFNAIHPSLLEISYDLRMIALIVILLRAGLKLKRETINRVGGTALLMSFVPSTFEGLAITFLAPMVFGFSLIQSAILGFIIAAVSPAVVVPSMIKLIEKGRGTDKGIPTMILAASSLDNAYVIVVFSTVLGMYGGGKSSLLASLMDVPVSIFTGGLAGAAAGLVVHWLSKTFSIRATKLSLVIIGSGVLLLWVQQYLAGSLAFSALIATMATGFVLLELDEERAHAVSNKLSKIWVAAEILLFVLVGALVNIHVALGAGPGGFIIIAAGLLARSAGTWLSVARSDMDNGERAFCIIAYIPKATVQAAVGAMPMAAGVPGGEIILAVAVLSILVTAPLGAIGIESSAKKLLKKHVP